MLTDDYNKHGHFHHYPLHVHENDDQLPIISQVGRGIKGDSFFVKVKEDSQYFTTLAGLSKDETTGAWTEEWVSENINGGKLMYQYNLRPYTDPQTFTITFRLKRPNREEWAWTTPAIPYIWDADNDGQGDVEGVVGVGVASLFIKKTTEANWNVSDDLTPHTIAQAMGRHEKLLYPTEWVRSQLNAPMPGAPYTVNLQYGIGGDIDAPNIDDLAKILGITVQNIRNIVANSPVPTATISDENLKKYIDRRDKEDFDHIHADMGFGQALVSDNNTQTYTYRYGSRADTSVSTPTIKAYIDAINSDLQTGIDNLSDNLDDYLKNIYGLFQAIVGKIPGASLNTSGTGASRTPNKNTNINGLANNIAVGDINLYSSGESNGIFTHTGSARDKDIKAV